MYSLRKIFINQIDVVYNEIDFIYICILITLNFETYDDNSTRVCYCG